MTAAAPTPTTPTPLFGIDVWTDVVCPWCYVGEARLLEAIEAEGLTGRVTLRAHSFELDPTAPTGSTEDNVTGLARRKGIPVQKVQEMEAQIGDLSREVGREYVSPRPMGNTRGVHRVLQALQEARGAEVATEFFLELQRGHFTDTVNPFDEEVVVARAVAAGLAEADARAAWAGTSHDDAVEEDVREAVAMGARGVPFFLFDDRYTAPGALPTETFRQALRQIAAEAEERASTEA